MTNRTRTDVLLIAGFCAFLFFYGMGQFGLIGADEPRYAQVAREMLERTATGLRRYLADMPGWRSRRCITGRRCWLTPCSG